LSDNNRNHSECGYKNGVLRSCAPLAVSYVPRQQEAVPQYEPGKALARGTLFPGLDLPLGNMANGAAPDTPLTELMALDFAAHDLSLYLDTHPEDREAFEVYKELLRLAKVGRERYIRQYGPLCKRDLEEAECYTWLMDPWPWDAQRRKEGKA